MATEVKIDEKAKKLVITMDLITPRASKSGKTMVIATTGGNLKTETTYKGKPVTVGVNAYYKEADDGE